MQKSQNTQLSISQIPQENKKKFQAKNQLIIGITKTLTRTLPINKNYFDSKFLHFPTLHIPYILLSKPYLSILRMILNYLEGKTKSLSYWEIEILIQNL